MFSTLCLFSRGLFNVKLMGYSWDTPWISPTIVIRLFYSLVLLVVDWFLVVAVLGARGLEKEEKCEAKGTGKAGESSEADRSATVGDAMSTRKLINRMPWDFQHIEMEDDLPVSYDFACAGYH